MSVLIYQVGRLEKGMAPIDFNIKNENGEKKGIKIKSVLSSFALKKYLVEYENKKDVKVILGYPVSLPFNKNLLNINPINNNIVNTNQENTIRLNTNLLNINQENTNILDKITISKSTMEAIGLSFELKEKIKKINEDEKERGKYLESPYDFFKFHPDSKEADDFIILHSIGKFNNVDFESSITDIILEIFLDMVQRVNSDYNINDKTNDKINERIDFKIDDKIFEKIDKIKNKKIDQNIDDELNIYIDISSGHNIYVSALIEAARKFSVFYNLLHYFDSNKIHIKFLFSDPIFSKDETYDIHKSYSLQQNIFFVSPLTAKEIKERKIARDIYTKKIYEIDIENLLDEREFYINDIENGMFEKYMSDNNSLKISEKEKKVEKKVDKKAKEFLINQREKEICFLLEKFGILFSALKNGTPLALYSFQLPEEAVVLRCMDDIIKSTRFLLSKSYLNSKNSEQLGYESIVKVLNSLAFLISIVKMLNEKGIEKKDQVTYSELIENFTNDKTSIFDLIENRSASLLISNELTKYKEPIKYSDRKSVFARTGNRWQILDKSMPPRDNPGKDYKNQFKNIEKKKENIAKNPWKKINENINPRNFLAHSGFERNLVEVKKENMELYFRYRKDMLEKVKKILIDNI